MLRITVELLPGGDKNRAKKIAEMELVNMSRGAMPDYAFRGCESFGDVLEGKIEKYPRWTNSIWDLIGRACAVMVGGKESFGRRKPLVKAKEFAAYKGSVDIDSLPKITKMAFSSALYGSGCPYYEGKNLAWKWDFNDFLEGGRSPYYRDELVVFGEDTLSWYKRITQK